MNGISPAELDRLIHALLDGVITPDEYRALQETMLADEEARRRYLALAELHNLLELQAEQMRSTGHAEIIPIVKLVRRQQGRSARLAFLAAAAALVILGVIMALVLVRNPEPAATVRFAPYSEFTIAHSGTPDEETAPNTLLPGSSIDLVRGTAELNFESGVRAIFHAPASITLAAGDRLELRDGTAWFRVPGKAAGFEVTTPQLQVVDLGTEFGIISDRRRPAGAGDEIHVFKGKVEARALHALKRHETLAAGEARAVHLTGRLVAIPPSPDTFLIALPLLPVAHWTFDKDFTDTTGKHNGTLVEQSAGNAGIDTATKRFGAGSLEVSAQEDFVDLSAAAVTLAHDADGFAISLWARKRVGSTDASGISLGTRGSNDNLVWPNGNGNLIAHASGEQTLFSWTPDNAWHHIVLVDSGAATNNWTVYLDNVAQTAQTNMQDFLIDSLGVGSSTNTGPWGLDGHLDEVRLFDHALSATEVANLYHHNDTVAPR